MEAADPALLCLERVVARPSRNQKVRGKGLSSVVRDRAGRGEERRGGENGIYS